MWNTCVRSCGLGKTTFTRRHITALLLAINIILGVYTIPTLWSKLRQNDSGVSEVGLNDIKRHVTDLQKFNVGRGSLEDTVDEHPYFYLHQAKEGCVEDEPFLLIAVCSAFHHFDLRETIRQTWASVIHRHKLSTKLIFMLGAPSGKYEYLQKHLTKESTTYGDIVQEDFIDSYINLTVKTIGVLKWALNFCPGVKFLMKTDDDVFVNVANLVGSLVDMATSKPRVVSGRFMVGNVIKNAKPLSDRSSKWYVPTPLFKGTKYPNYLSGSAYVITGNALEDLYTAATSRPVFYLEDIFITGILSRDLKIPLVHVDKFTYIKPRMLHPCAAKSFISSHEMSVSNLQDIWRSLHNMDLDCTAYTNNRIRKTV